jgi:hypothetical protein
MACNQRNLVEIIFNAEDEHRMQCEKNNKL